MERSEPTLVPEWLRNAGNLNTARSALHSDQTAQKLAKDKSLVNNNGHDFGRSFSSDRATTSAYFRRSSSSNYSGHLRPRNSYGRNQNFRDREKNTYVSYDKDFSDSFLRRSQFMVSGKREDTWHKKGNANGLLTKPDRIGSFSKTAFQREFPSLKAEEKTGLSSAIQSLPLGTSSVIGGEKWTSALAEVPVLVKSKSSTSLPLGTTTTLNMKEAVAQGPSRAQTPPQLSVGTQRLEELAIKQSRQLIPVTPSMPKTLLSNDKKKNILSQQRPSSSSSVTHSPRGVPGPLKVDVSKPTPSRAPLNNPVPERKPLLTLLEKKPTSQVKSRNDFFNSVRKKSMANSSSVAESSVENPSGAHLPETRDDLICNDDALQKHVGSNGKKHPRSGPIFSEEEEAAFLRSMGWEENDHEDVLTEEEINAFFRDVTKYIKSKPSLKILQGGQPKFLLPFGFHMGGIGGISSGLSSIDVKLKS